MTPQSCMRSMTLSVLVLCSGVLAGPRYQLVLQGTPAASVNSVAVSPEGSLIATGSGEGGIRLYDATTGEMLRVLGDVGDRSVVFSPDGRTLAAAGFHMDKLVKLVDVRTGDILRTFAGHSQIETCAAAISPDGKLFASACRDNEVLLWDMADRTLLHRWEGTPSIALAFSPDGSTLAGGGADQVLRLWDVSTGELRGSLKGHGDCVVTLAFSPDGTRLASGSCDWGNHRGRNTAEFGWFVPPCDSQWILWDLSSGAMERSVTEPGRLLSLAIAPDGQSLAAAIGKVIRLYNLQTQRPGAVIATSDFDATSVAFTPDGAAVISSSHDQSVKRVRVATAQVEWEAPGSYEQVNSLAVSANGSVLATGSSDRRFAVRTMKAGHPGLKSGALRLWNARTGQLLRRLGGPYEQVMAVAISPDGKRVAGGGATQDGLGFVRIYDTVTGAIVWSQTDHAAEVVAAAFSPEGESLASGGCEGIVNLRDASTGAVVRTFGGHAGGATSVAFSDDGTIMACGEGRGGVRTWNASIGHLLQTCLAADSKASAINTDRLMTCIAFLPGSTRFYVNAATIGNTYGEKVRLWDALTGELSEARDMGGRAITLSPDGKVLAAGGKGIQLYSLPSGQKLRRLSGHLKKIQAIAFSRDSRLVFGGGSYGTVNVWEVATGRHLVTLFAFQENLQGSATDDWLAYHPDGFYDGSPGVEGYLAWRAGERLLTPTMVGGELHRPDRVQSALRLDGRELDSP